MIESIATVSHLLVACDLDGTLAPIVDDPDLAEATAGSLRALRALAALPDTIVAVVSGRTHHELERRFGTEGFVLVGEHGADRGQAAPPDPESLIRARRLVDEVAERTPGSRVEHKGRSVVFHHRRVDDPGPAVDSLRAGAAVIHGLSLMEGKAVLELSVSAETKGTALMAMRADVGADALLFVGDDVTDETVFGLLGEADLGVKVGEGPTAAHHRVEDPAAVADLLQLLHDLRANG
jgi:trehalose 6-phosphate phosphatase